MKEHVHHDLKLNTIFWEPKTDGRKPWELRSTWDRTFREGDTVTFHEVADEACVPTGRTYGPATITYVLNESPLMDDPDRCIFTHTQV